MVVGITVVINEVEVVVYVVVVKNVLTVTSVSVTV
jgi:hypothetical protein